MKTLIAIVGLLLIAASTQIQAAGYGSIAYSTSTSRWGVSYGQGDRANADAVALGYCGQADCTVVVWEFNQCASLAVGTTGNYGWGLDVHSSDADARALSECSLRGPDCTTIAWTCN